MDIKYTRITLRIEEMIDEQLEALKVTERLSKNQLINKILREYFERKIKEKNV